MKTETIDLSKHTKGEWQLHKHASANVVSEDGRSIANCGGYNSNVNSADVHEENIANAELIVKAVNNYERMKKFIEEMAFRYSSSKWIAGEANEILNQLNETK